MKMTDASNTARLDAAVFALKVEREIMAAHLEEMRQYPAVKQFMQDCIEDTMARSIARIDQKLSALRLMEGTSNG